MGLTVPLHLAAGHSAVAAHVHEERDLPSALGEMGLHPPRPVMVVVGGADGLGDAQRDRLRVIFRSAIIPVAERFAAIGLDGGTRAGVMRLYGESRAAARSDFPLVGVVASATIRSGDDLGAEDEDSAVLEPHHTHFIVVPGDRWGDESPWLARTATMLAGDADSVTVLVNGGEIAVADAELSVEAGRQVVVVAGSGRAADVLTAAEAGEPSDARAAALIDSGLVRSVPMDSPAVLAAVLTAILDGRREGP
jgi:hypothetical protein